MITTNIPTYLIQEYQSSILDIPRMAMDAFSTAINDIEASGGSDWEIDKLLLRIMSGNTCCFCFSGGRIIHTFEDEFSEERIHNLMR